MYPCRNQQISTWAGISWDLNPRHRVPQFISFWTVTPRENVERRRRNKWVSFLSWVSFNYLIPRTIHIMSGGTVKAVALSDPYIATSSHAPWAVIISQSSTSAFSESITPQTHYSKSTRPLFLWRSMCMVEKEPFWRDGVVRDCGEIWLSGWRAGAAGSIEQ